jgi:putative ABC transport system permease protein
MKETYLHPPRLAQRLLRKLTDYQERFAMAGDLEEAFHQIGKESGYSQARRWYWRQCLDSIPKYLVYLTNWSIVMFRNYLKTALRNLARQRVLSFVNILGLSLGLASCILIYLYIADEISFDRFHEKADSLYGVVCRDEFHDESGVWGTMAMGPVLEEYFPEIQRAVRMNDRNQATVRYNDKVFNERPVFTDPSFFEVFSFPLLRGDPGVVLQSRDSVVLTKGTAIKYFGREHPLGKSLTMIFGEMKKDFIVSGIAQDVPANSTIQFDMLLNVNNLSDIEGPEFFSNWRRFNTDIYVLIEEGSLPETVNSRFPSFVKQYFQEMLEERRSRDSWKGEGELISFSLHNIKSLHLNPVLRNVGASDIKSSLILAGIAFLILAIACINFINLSIARASGRTIEIGMRKVLGAGRKQLIRQFWTESLVLTFLAMIMGILMASLFLPIFNRLAEKNLSLGSFINAANLLAFLIILIIVALASGSYPSLIMSGFHPVEILKGKLKVGRKTLLTKSLLVVQFSLSVFLIIATLTMAKQIRSMRQKELGFKKEGVVVVNMQEGDWRQGQKTERWIDLFKERLSGHGSVKNISGSSIAFNRWLVMNHIRIKGQTYDVYFDKVYYDFLNTMGIDLVEGRDFSREFPSDSSAVIVNRNFVEQYEFEQPLGEVIWDAYDDSTPLRIIGVAEDYHIRSPRHEIKPVILHMTPSFTVPHLLVRISLENIPETIELLERTWKDIQPDKPFLFSFLDEDIEAAYGRQKRWNAIVLYSSLLAILITCMGIFALTSLTISRRIKEIGIRKVLGAGVIQIVNMVYKEFILLIIIANVIAWPIAYLAMHTWLQGFAHRATIGVGIFLLTGALALVIALLTVSYQSIRAALANPVDAIRYE